MSANESRRKTMNETMTDNQYHTDKRIGRSGLQLVAKSPAHYFAEYLDPNRVWKEPTKAMQIGTAFHAAVLEPNEFTNKVVIEPSRWPTKSECGITQEQQKLDFYQQHRGKVAISADDLEMIKNMYQAIYNNPIASTLLKQKGLAEQAILFDHPETGTPSKIKPDWINIEQDVLIDIKTAEDASPAEFAKSCVNHWYHVQAAWYIDGMMYAQGFEARGFVFIVVEKKPPYAVATYYAPPEMVALGRKIYMPVLEKYEKCRQTNVWPGYEQGLQPINLPGWAFK
jgi:hypothetical protein